MEFQDETENLKMPIELRNIDTMNIHAYKYA